jgi:hypothetical protein
MYDPSMVSIQTFVDDPCLTISGSAKQRDMVMAATILVWRGLGYPLSFSKGVRGKHVVWIGGQLTITPKSVVAEIKKSILADLTDQVFRVCSSNVVSRKELLSLAGRGNHIAALLWSWRPFLQWIWGALYDRSSAAPPNCIWTKQIEHATRWMKAFLSGTRGSLSRTYYLDAFLNRGAAVTITIDASPWGLAAFLCIDDAPVSWFSSCITEIDEVQFGKAIGSCEGQQLWESLAALVSLRVWKHKWKSGRVRLKVRGDNVTMLSLLVRLRPPTDSPGLGLIARELALDIAESVYAPDVSEHLPGIANMVADALSRKFEVGPGNWKLPQFLLNTPEILVPSRDINYYRTLQA